ncbi:growth-regulating factor 1-like [Cornus florida]|uniref:growth-regulating factor 1-like n=1 Tax=Cornus florida TaxID=4283 RepID=UPI00289D5A57|nr:growth-regulating factor 1-like [Cornus florida]
MDFGVVGLDGFLGSDTGFTSSDPADTKQKWYGSGFLKQERSSGTATEDDWRGLKLAKHTSSDDFSPSKPTTMLLHHQQRSSPLLRSNTTSTNNNSSLCFSTDAQQHMLSFSSPNSQTVTLPFYHQSSNAYGRNTGHGSGGLNAATMHGAFAGVRGPFTPSQWMELEHQALIYKYITANVPIPSNLLIPIRKALDSVGFSSFSGGPLRPTTLGWGAFHLGFSNNADPEPGRCRRTDGKKWRCSRDAVADQKYCERHMNRGRHRSRKPVEGQTGHSVTGPTTTTTATTDKLMPMASSTSASVVSGGGASNLGLSHHHHHQIKNLQPGEPSPCSAPHVNNRIFLNKENMGERMQDASDLSMLSPAIGGLKENQFSIAKQRNPYEDSSRPDFGLVCSDSLLNPVHKSSSLVDCRNYSSSQELNNRETGSQHSLHQFIDDWPKNQSERSAISWPEIDLQSDRTQLSISIPMASSDFMSSTSSPANENPNPTLSPLRLSRELDSTTQMGLGVGSVIHEPNQRQASWIPISWETSMGGPLGEVLHSTNNSASDCKNSSALNLMTKGWDNSPRLASSPTGVLQKTTFRSLSSSSAGSSPRTENNKTHEGASLCNDLRGSTLVNSSLPAL